MFHSSAHLLPQLYEDLLPNRLPKCVAFTVNFNDEDYYVVDTTADPVRITSIDFTGELAIIETAVPLSQFSEYRSVENKESVSQTASFSFPLRGETVTLDFHHLTASGQTHLAVRRHPETPCTKHE